MVALLTLLYLRLMVRANGLKQDTRLPSARRQQKVAEVEQVHENMQSRMASDDDWCGRRESKLEANDGLKNVTHSNSSMSNQIDASNLIPLERAIPAFTKLI